MLRLENARNISPNIAEWCWKMPLENRASAWCQVRGRALEGEAHDGREAWSSSKHVHQVPRAEPVAAWSLLASEPSTARNQRAQGCNGLSLAQAFAALRPRYKAF